MCKLKVVISVFILLTGTPIYADEWTEYAEPRQDTIQRELKLWGTYYKMHVASSISSGFPLLGKKNKTLGPKLSKKDWCDSALEGTVAVSERNITTIYTYMDKKGPIQLDCSNLYSKLKNRVLQSMSKSRFVVSKAPYGYGVKGWHIVPYKTIAVDKEFIPYGSVIYVPKARGLEIILPSGNVVLHNGYFYAGDTGGAIKGNHVDVFTGVLQKNPFASFVKSDMNKTFQAYLISNPKIQVSLDQMHHR
jgi:3D (Asp-Asp-Asp) domain-containing protein